MTAPLDRRLLFVTGKGGSGKTTVAAGLGLLAAGLGKKTLVCELEPKSDLSGAYECGPTEFKSREVRPLLWVMSMDTEAALREYLQLQMRLPVVGRLGPVARAFDFVASAAPGVREVLTIGKLCYEVRERNYDLVVADASSSGHVVGQLAAPKAINELVRGGRVLADTDWMMEILADASVTGVCITATPEEMPVSEALELAGRLRTETSVDLACVVANRVLPALFGRGEQAVYEGLRAPERIEALSERVGASAGAVRAVLAAAGLAVSLRRLGASHLRRLRAGLDPAVPVLYVPAFFGGGPGLEATGEVAAALGEELGG